MARPACAPRLHSATAASMSGAIVGASTVRRSGKPMTTLVTGAGLIGTAFAAEALARGEGIVFLDPEPRADFLTMKLGAAGYTLARKDVRDLPALIETIKENGVATVV